MKRLVFLKIFLPVLKVLGFVLEHRKAYDRFIVQVMIYHRILPRWYYRFDVPEELIIMSRWKRFLS